MAVNGRIGREHALRGLRPQKGCTTGRTCTNDGVKHQVLCHDRRPGLLTACWTRRLNVIEQRLEIAHGQSIRVRMMWFEEGIRPARFIARRANGHEITELGHVTAGFEHRKWRDGGAGDFDDITLAEPMIPPDGLDFGPQPSTDRSKIVEPFGPAMDLKRRQDHPATAQHTGQTFQPLHGRLRLHHVEWLVHEPFNPSAKIGLWAGLKRSEADLQPWDRPWSASPIRRARVVTCASRFVPLKRCCLWLKTRATGPIQSGPLWSWKQPALGGGRALDPVQQEHFTRLVCLQTTRRRLSSTRHPLLQQPLSSVGDGVESAGLEAAPRRRLYILQMGEATPRAS